MNQQFYKSFRSVIEIGRYSGLPQPWYETPSETKLAFISGFHFLLLIFLIFKLICSFYAIGQVNSFEEFMFNTGVVVLTVDGIFLLVFYKLRSRDLKKLTDDLDGISSMINESKHATKGLFDEMYTQESGFIMKLTNVLAPATAVLLPFFVFVVPITEIIEGSYGTSQAMVNHCPFEMSLPYELLLFMEVCNIVFPTMQKLMSEFIMLSLFKTEFTYYKYLSRAVADLDSVPDPQRFLKTWAEIHQAVIQSSSEMIKFVSPLVLWYFVGFVVEMAGDLIFHIDGSYGNLLQKVVLGFYDIIFIGHLYLMCSFADELSVEAESLAMAVYDTPWYKMDKSIKSDIQLIIQIANQPVQIVAYFSPCFTLNKDTFLTFMKSIISGYMGFSQIMQMKDNAPQEITQIGT